MRVQDITSAALGLMSALSVTRAASLPAAAVETVGLVARETPACQAVLCITPNEKQCGLYVSYTNGKRSESVQTSSGGGRGCSFELLRKQTNHDGFWANLNFFGSSGLSIGYSQTGRSIKLGAATLSVENHDKLALQCENIFDIKGIDVDLSGWYYYANFNTQLY
ncbi:hypothetical protein NQ176_g510 [Zarea fungicola]|uniref:Uncharacterized protein n=1 Tax=Zarea fungicola TaxID=93591 RepID=A0ACC1NXL9_9HYPO|nr:hypothetical protein NQ176_g510 [Lecanicillium fungicola]